MKEKERAKAFKLGEEIRKAKLTDKKKNAVTKLQALVRGRLAHNDFTMWKKKRDEWLQAITKIQALHRGDQGRGVAADKKEENEQKKCHIILPKDKFIEKIEKEEIKIAIGINEGNIIFKLEKKSTNTEEGN